MVSPPPTVTRPELLVDGSDFEFRRLIHALFGFLGRHETVRAGHAERIGLRTVDYTAIISIRQLATREGEVTVGRLAEHLYLSGAFVTAITNRLAKKEYIRKRPDPADRRRVILEVTEAGDKLLAEVTPVLQQVNDIQFDCLNADEFRQLTDIVERLIDSSERAIQYQSYVRATAPKKTQTEVGLSHRGRVARSPRAKSI
jgi:MarR family transcriptional regulator, organic hydroperoxide resistance regulator